MRGRFGKPAAFFGALLATTGMAAAEDVEDLH